MKKTVLEFFRKIFETKIFSKFLALALCSMLFFLGVFYSYKVFTMPSFEADKLLAGLSDYAESPADISKLEALSKYINSIWWKDYSKSRFIAKKLKKTDDIYKLSNEFQDKSLKAYLWAYYALQSPNIQYAFYKLGERDAAFASLIFLINKNLPFEKESLEVFKAKHLANLTASRREYYGNVLRTEAKKRSNLNALLYIAEVFSYEIDYDYLDLALRGEDFAKFKFTQNAVAYKTLTKSLQNNDETQKEKLRADILNHLNKVDFWFSTRKLIYAQALEVLGFKEDSKSVVVDYYKFIKAVDMQFFEAATKNMIYFFAKRNDVQAIKEYICAYASNIENTRRITLLAAIRLAEEGYVSEAINLCEGILGIKNNIKLNYSLPCKF